MNSITCSYHGTCLINKDSILRGWERLLPEIERVRAIVKKGGYESLYASVNLPDDDQMRAEIKGVAAEKKELKPTMLVVVGIGGSSLGAVAVHQALFGTLYNDQQPDIKFYIADTVDTDYINDIVLLVEQELEKGNNVIINVVSKSGTTIETVTNAELFIYLIRKAYPDTYQHYIVITSDENSELWHYALEQSMTKLAIPTNVGGRYSVFSPAGLFPLALLGVDIDELCRGARDMRDACVSDDEACLNVGKGVNDRDIARTGEVEGLSDEIENTLECNLAALRAILLFEQYERGIAIHDLFVFSKDLSGVGAWYRQLVGESLGKEKQKNGEIVPVGILPTVSIGTVDLHSVAQLYLGGPNVRFTTFMSIKNNIAELRVQGKAMSAVMESILEAVQKEYQRRTLPFVALTIPEKKAYYIGGLMQLHMLEIMYLGFLLEVNPFDQPHVESYKQEAIRLLRRS